MKYSDFKIWNYPEVKEKFAEEAILLDKPPLHLQDDIPVPVSHELNTLEEEVSELNKQILYLNSIAQDLNTLVNSLDEDLFQHLINLVKKVVKKIILKELKHDEQLLQKMVIDAISKLKESGTYQLMVSPEDHHLFLGHDLSKNITIILDKNLKQGDFIIKSKHNELKAILEDRINACFESELC